MGGSAIDTKVALLQRIFSVQVGNAKVHAVRCKFPKGHGDRCQWIEKKGVNQRMSANARPLINQPSLSLLNWPHYRQAVLE